VVAITEDEIRALASFKGATAPVTSCYLDVDGGRYARQQDLVRAVERLVRDTATRHREQPSVLADVQRVVDLIRGGIDRSRVRGLAVFSCSAHSFWQVVELPVSVRNQVVVNHTPAVRQLETVLDEYEPFGLLLADRQRARVLVYSLGEVVHRADVEDPLPRGDDTGHDHRKDRGADHTDALVNQHLRRSADAAFEVFKARGFERLIIGASDDVVPALEAMLHPYLQERLVARCGIPVHASDDEVRSAALTIEADVERRKEAEVVARLRDAAAGGRRGVTGLADTLRALVDRRVETLLVSSGYAAPGWRCDACGWFGRIGRACPTCGETMRAVEDIVEEAIEEAILQSCDVEVCMDNADLDVVGRIGALLRY
jgi:peptide chain release factor subunit 1